MDRNEDAARVLVDSVNMYPYNWSAWKTLASVLSDFTMVHDLPLLQHWMKEFFMMEALHERHASLHDPYVSIPEIALLARRSWLIWFIYIERMNYSNKLIVLTSRSL
jgi:hypothetical protein